MRDLFLYIHIGACVSAILTIALADKQALSWVRGTKMTLDRMRLVRYHRITWACLIILIGTGIVLLYPLRDFLLGSPVFYLKIVFVSILFVNGFVIGRLMNIAADRSFASLSLRKRIPLFLSGIASSVGWVGAVMMALFLFF